jgi:hypothetical protein
MIDHNSFPAFEPAIYDQGIPAEPTVSCAASFVSVECLYASIESFQVVGIAKTLCVYHL